MAAKVRDTIAWTNQDVVAHTSTARNGDFDITIAAGKTAAFVVRKAGQVDYCCRLHSNMTARLTVQD